MLSQIENQILMTLEERSGLGVNDKEEFKTQYHSQGNFLVCVLQDNYKVLSVGVSKRNPIDNLSDDIGNKRSFNRAVRSLLGYHAK